MKLSRDMENQFAREYLIDLDPTAAAQRCGVQQSHRAYGLALLKRPRVSNYIHDEMQARNVRLQIDADFVLSELMRQLARLMAMNGADMSDLYDEYGSFKPVKDWPLIWRTRLINAMDVQQTFHRSHDGEVGDEEGRTSWDKTGEVVKIKRESSLQIEREIRETLQLIGEHTKVNAWPKKEPEPAKQEINVTVKNLAMVCSPEELQRIKDRMLATAGAS